MEAWSFGQTAVGAWLLACVARSSFLRALFFTPWFFFPHPIGADRSARHILRHARSVEPRIRHRDFFTRRSARGSVRRVGQLKKPLLTRQKSPTNRPSNQKFAGVRSSACCLSTHVGTPIVVQAESSMEAWSFGQTAVGAWLLACVARSSFLRALFFTPWFFFPHPIGADRSARHILRHARSVEPRIRHRDFFTRRSARGSVRRVGLERSCGSSA